MSIMYAEVVEKLPERLPRAATAQAAARELQLFFPSDNL